MVLGDPGPVQAFPEELAWLLAGGGSLLIATDRTTGRLLPELPVRVQAGPVEVTPESAYGGVTACPIVDYWESSSPLYLGVRRLAFNCPGFLGGVDSRQAHGAWLLTGGSIRGAQLDMPLPLVAGRQVGSGRLLVVADQSIFSNEMILELDNLVFASNCARWLGGRSRHSERRALWFEGGQSIENWLDPRFETGKWESNAGAGLIGLVNEVIAGLEDEDVLNELLRRNQHRLRRDVLHQLTILLPSGLLFLLLCWWLLRARRRSPPPEPSTVLTAPMVPSASLLEERRLAVLAMGEYLDPACQLAREVFAATLAGNGLPDTMPALTVKGGFYRRWKWRRRLRRLWHLAKGQHAGRIGRQQFLQLQRQIHRLQQLISDGEIELGLACKS